MRSPLPAFRCQGRTHREVTSELVLREEGRVFQAGHQKSKGFQGKGRAYTRSEVSESSSVKELETTGEGATDLQPGSHGMP